jgi:hypothetical protein
LLDDALVSGGGLVLDLTGWVIRFAILLVALGQPVGQSR